MRKITQDLIRRLNDQAYTIRRDVIELADHAGEGHCAPALSITDILTALYCVRLNVDPKDPNWPDRDRFVLSKGHACLALYVTLYHAGFFDRDTLYTFLNKHVGWQALREDLTRMYMKAFSEDELKAMNDFYITPTGQKVIHLVPQLVSQRNQIAMHRLQENIGELQQNLSSRQRQQNNTP